MAALPGSGIPSTPAASGGIETAAFPEGVTARIDIDTETGTAKVVSNPDKASSRAVFAGSAVNLVVTAFRRVSGEANDYWDLTLGVQNQVPMTIGVKSGILMSFTAAPIVDQYAFNTDVSTNATAGGPGLGNNGNMYFNRDRSVTGTVVGSQAAGFLPANSYIVASAYDPINGVWFSNYGLNRLQNYFNSGSLWSGSVGAADGSPGDVDGFQTAARLRNPAGITAFTGGNFLVADYGNQKIKLLDNSGNISAWKANVGNVHGLSYGTINGQGVVAMSDNLTGEVYVIHPTTKIATRITQYSGYVPSVLIRDNSIYVARYSAGVVTRLACKPTADAFTAASYVEQPSIGTVAATGASSGAFIFRLQKPFGLFNAAGDRLGIVDDGPGAGYVSADPISAPLFTDSLSKMQVGFQSPDGYKPGGSAYYRFNTSLGQTDSVTRSVRINTPAAKQFSLYVTVEADQGGVPLESTVTNPGTGSSRVYVQTISGNSAEGGDNDGFGNEARFQNLRGIAADDSGNFYVAERNRIRRVDRTGRTTTIIGNGSGSALADGTGYSASLVDVQAIASDATGNTLYIATRTAVLRAAGIGSGSALDNPGAWQVSLIAGSPTLTGVTDGAGQSARFTLLAGIALNRRTDTVYVTDYSTHRIRKIALVGPSTAPSNWSVTTLAGSSQGLVDGGGSNARFNFPYGIAIDTRGDIIVADSGNNVIRRVTPGGQATILVGTGAAGYLDGNAAQLNQPELVVADNLDRIYFVDGAGRRVRMITNGQTSTVALLNANFRDANGGAAGGIVRALTADINEGRLGFLDNSCVRVVDRIIGN